MSFKAVVIGGILACTAIGSSALTLGRVRGAAWLGQPLDVAVLVGLDGSSGDKNLCAEADVFHADSRQDSARIRINTEPAEQADSVYLRINSSTPVDEPVVTLYVRAGCTQKTARRYVFLADVADVNATANKRVPPLMPPAVATVPLEAPVKTASAAESSLAVATPTPSSGSGGSPSDIANASIARVIQSRISNAAEAQQAPSPQQTPSEKKRKTPKSERTDATTPKANAVAAKNLVLDRPRLKLDPMDGLFGPVTAVQSNQPAGAPSTPAASGKAIELRDSEGLSELKANVQAQLAQSAQSEALLLAMRERLERAEAERVPVFIVYVLLALLMGCIGAVAYLWRKRMTSIPLE